MRSRTVEGPIDALVLSITSFHGRDFFPGPFPLHNPLVPLTASEAVLGLLIEAFLVATLARLLLGGLERANRPSGSWQVPIGATWAYVTRSGGR